MSMRYVPVVFKQVDKDGNTIEGGFERYGIVDRAQKNRVIFSSRSAKNNYIKLMSMMGLGEDDFSREEFEKKMLERAVA